MAYWDEPYQPDRYCVFCQRNTDETREFSYSITWPRLFHTIPVHVQCYKRKIFLIFLKAILVLILSEIGLFLLAELTPWLIQSLWVSPALSLAVTLPFTLIFAIVVGIEAYSEMELKIIRYIDLHTDHEDHYKSDREKWRRGNI